MMVDSRKFEDEVKGREAISTGDIKIQEYTNYYDVSETIVTAGANDPNDFDSNVYNRERIYQILERNAKKLTVANDAALGGAALFVVVSHIGTTGFSGETPIYPQEKKVYFNVYELRLRSPTQGLPYRVTEYDIHS